MKWRTQDEKPTNQVSALIAKHDTGKTPYLNYELCRWNGKMWVLELEQRTVFECEKFFWIPEVEILKTIKV